ncbi:MAG: PAS domain-containing protein [Burkholderiaceae bacterium]
MSFSFVVFSGCLSLLAFYVAHGLLSVYGRVSWEVKLVRHISFWGGVISVSLGLLFLVLCNLLGNFSLTGWSLSSSSLLQLTVLAFILSLAGFKAIRTPGVARPTRQMVVASLTILGLWSLHALSLHAMGAISHVYRYDALLVAAIISFVLSWMAFEVLLTPEPQRRVAWREWVSTTLFGINCSLTLQSIHGAWQPAPILDAAGENGVLAPQDIDLLTGSLGLFFVSVALILFCISRWLEFRAASDRAPVAVGAVASTAMSEQVGNHLREMHERYLRAMDSVEEGLWDMDLATGSVYISQAWTESLGYTNKAAYQNLEEWRLLLHPDDADHTRQQLNDHLQGRSPVYFAEYRLRKGNGDWLWVSSRGKLLKDPYGNALRVVGIHHDIQQRKLAEEALARAFETEKRLSTLKSEFVTMLSHELRTPLTVLVSSRALLGASLDSGVITRGSLNRYLGQMDQAIGRLRTLVEETLTYVQIETTLTKPHIGAVDMPALVQRAADEIIKRDTAGHRDGAGPRLAVKVVSALDNPFVYVDEVALFQVVKQLLEHSFHLSSLERQIRIGLSENATHVILRLAEDTFASNDAPQQGSFDEFCKSSEQIDTAIDKLGLAIVKRLVDRMGGDISASTGRDGVKIVFNIPKGQPHDVHTHR